MTTITILQARNKSLINKKVFVDETTNIATIGRTSYLVNYDIHQPNKDKGNYETVSYKLSDLKTIILHKTDSSHLNTGIWITEYKILNKQ